MSSAVEAVLKHDRRVVATALAILTILAWAYVLQLAWQMAMPSAAPAPSGNMAGMDMGASASSTMDMSAAVGPAFQSWGIAYFAFIFMMWAVMMVGMMTPSVAPMVLLYAGVGRRARADHKPFAATGWFLGGYLFVWIAFSVLATSAQWGLTRIALLTPMMAMASGALGGVVLIAAGIYQWTPLKQACLAQCQTPLRFLTTHGGFRPDPLGAFRLGAEHGLYCLGCCWALMLLLFVGGIMNILWIAGLAVLVLLEKVVPTGRLIPRISGALLVAIGAWFLARPFL